MESFEQAIYAIENLLYNFFTIYNSPTVSLNDAQYGCIPFLQQFLETIFFTKKGTSLALRVCLTILNNDNEGVDLLITTVQEFETKIGNVSAAV